MGQMINFGVGFLTLLVNNQPVQVGIVKDVSLDISFTIKSLIGNQQFPVDVARGEGKITGKAKSGQINSALLNFILAGSTVATGQIVGVYGEGPSTPTTNTITAVNGANFNQDLGVFDTTAGIWLKQVASGPVTGQYSVNATSGVYTFAAADATHLFALYYSYKSTASGVTVSYTNQLMGANTVFQLALFNDYSSAPLGGKSGVMLPCATFSKLSVAYKNNDYTETDLDFEVFADASGKIMYQYMSK